MVGKTSPGWHPGHLPLLLRTIYFLLVKWEPAAVPVLDYAVENLGHHCFEPERRQRHSVDLATFEPSSPHRSAFDFRYEEECPCISAFSPNLGSMLLLILGFHGQESLEWF